MIEGPLRYTVAGIEEGKVWIHQHSKKNQINLNYRLPIMPPLLLALHYI